VTVWEILKIEPTDDEREIKRAYAKELKLIRPGEDPLGFQKLREARDQAIWLGAYDVYDDSELDDESDDFDEGETLEPSINHSVTEQTSAVVEELVEPVELSLPPETIRENIDGIERETVDQITIDEDILFDQKEDDHNQSVDDRDFSDEHIREKIETLIGPWGGWDLGKWQSFINELRESPFETSKYAEYEILQAIASAVLHGPSTTRDKQSDKLNVLSYLNQEFGWTQADRRVYDQLSDEEADALLEIIRGSWRDPTFGGKRPYFDARGFPLLVEDDFLSYIGKNDTVYERYYNDSKNADRSFQISWSWAAFLGAPLWLAWRCNDGMEALFGIIYVIALFFAGFGFKHLGDGSFSNDITFYIGLCMIIGLHIISGLWGKRMLINTMASIFTEVEEDETLTEPDRQKKIASVGQGGVKSIFDFLFGMLGIALIVGVVFTYFTSK